MTTNMPTSLPTRTYGTVRCGGGLVEVRADPHVAIRVKQWFPRADKTERGRLVMQATPEVANELLFLLARWPMEMTDVARDHLAGLSRDYEESQAALLSILDGGGERLDADDWLEPALPPKMLLVLRDAIWQTTPARIVLATGRTLCGDVLGLGKTFEGLLVLRDPRARPAVVVCPPHLQLQWVNQTAKFFPTLRTHIVKTTKVYDPVKARGMNGYAPDVLIISYSKMVGWVDYLTRAAEAGLRRTVIFDEMHMLRNDGSQRYRACFQLARAMLFRMGLTGTIVWNYGADAHTVIRVLDPDALGTRQEFVREWGKSLGAGKVGVADPRALGLYLREQGLHVRRTRPEVGEPVLGVEKIPVEVNVDQQTMDAGMDDLVSIARLIIEGGDKERVFLARGDIDWKLRRLTGVAKAPYVAAFVKLLLDEADKVVLWGWHRDVYAIWLRKLAAFNPALYTGSESPRQKAINAARFIGGEDLHRFNQEEYAAGRLRGRRPHDESRVLIMSHESGAGLDGLQHVCHIGVFGELAWSPAQHDQCEGRLVDRVGQTEVALMYYLHAADGADPPMLETLGVKREQGELIRDPSLPLFTHGNDMSDRPRLLAEQVLERARRRR